MITHKYITKIIIAIMAVAVILVLGAVAYSGKLSDMLGGATVSMEYEDELFDTSEIIDINIVMDEDDWNTMLDNAISEEYYAADVVVNGETFSNVAIRPKGNTSLSSIAMDPDTDRFSLKLEFDHFTDGQTCFGLDKLILNNNYADATNMKEALIYDMYQYIGAEASLYNYAKVSVNGEYRGVYLALEGVEQSFMLRNFGTQDGELYKPDSMEMGGDKSSGSSSGSSGGFGPGGFSMGKGGANLNYSDDDLDSYSTIWDGSITDTADADHTRVVKALKAISEGEDIEKYLDVDNILKYMAVHAFAVNMDSLSGSMAHNYYLYEYDGQLNLFPWDYNLSFGGMSMGGADGTSVVNDAIDTPFDGTDFFDVLLEDEEYLEIYHEYLRQLCEEYVQGGRLDEVYERIRAQIDELVETDPTAFYDADEYHTAVELLYETVKLRAESVLGQLDGTIPSTDEGQKTDSSALIDASHIDITAMGQMDMGGGGGPGDSRDESEEGADGETGETAEGPRGGFSGGPGGDSEEGAAEEGGKEGGGFGGKPQGGFGGKPQGGFGGFGEMPDMSSFGGGEMPDMSNFDPGNMPDMSSFGGGEMPDMGNFNPGDMGSFDMSNMPDMGNFTPGNMPDGAGGDFPGGSSVRIDAKTVIIYAVCLAGMVAAIVVVRLIKRRRWQ